MKNLCAHIYFIIVLLFRGHLNMTKNYILESNLLTF